MFKIISSSFPYNWYNVIHVIKKINSIINFKESKCVETGTGVTGGALPNLARGQLG